MHAALISPSTFELGSTCGGALYSPFIDLMHHRVALYLDEHGFILEQYKQQAARCDITKTILKILQDSNKNSFIKVKTTSMPVDLMNAEIDVLKSVLSHRNLITKEAQSYSAFVAEIRGYGIQLFDYPLFSTIFHQQNKLTYEALTELILECLKTMIQGKVGKKIENLHNDLLRDGLRAYGKDRSFTIADQSRAGESSTGGGVGELDLYVLGNNSEPFSVIECLSENSFGPKNEFVLRHFNKLINDYDKVEFHRNFLITYCESASFNSAFENYVALIKNANSSPIFSTPYKILRIEEQETKVTNIKLIVTTHLRESQDVQVYHFFADFSQSAKSRT